jgi:starvation-inducible DNA-binding protein
MARFPNHTGMNENAEVVEQILQTQLATCFDLYSQIKQAHWNLKGPGFIGIHQMFDNFAEEIINLVDTIAERIAALGGYPLGYLSAASANSELDNPVDDLVQDLDWVAFILDQHHQYSTKLYNDIKSVGPLDPASEDLLIEIVRSIDKNIYFLSGHLEDDTSAEAYETGSDVDQNKDEETEVVDDGEDATI